MDQVSEVELFQGKSYKEISEILQNRYSHSIKTDLKRKQGSLLEEEVQIAAQEVSD